MKVSYNRLQEYFSVPLPKVADLVEGIVFHAFEVEEVISVGDDTFLDIKILPDRAFDCQDETGIAKEISVIFNLPLKSQPEEKRDRTVEVSLTLINKRLGLSIPKEEVIDIFTRLSFYPVEETGVVICSIPASRPDITLPEHLIKEVGRIYGYDQISPIELPALSKVEDAENFVKIQEVRAKLVELGFSEIYGYSFVDKGDLEVLKPLQQDKPFLRTTLSDGLKEKIELNLKNTLFDDELIRVFDVGSVFPASGEEVRVAVGLGTTKAKFNNPEFLSNVLVELGVGQLELKTSGNITLVEFPLNLVKVDSEGDKALVNYCREVGYQKFSPFPRIIRDIALFVPEGTNPEAVAKIIKANGGELLVRGPVLFDQFSKEGRTSLAFRLVFQASDRTLTDEEVGPIMEKITLELEKEANFEVRK